MARSKRLKVGDLVQVISGKDKGKQGKITKLLSDDDKVVVEGINTVTRNQRPTPRNQQGGQIKKDAPMHASKVMPVDPTTGKPTRVKIKVGEDGKKARVAKSGAEITAS
jgi:large subunit ribosomal protein L24